MIPVDIDNFIVIKIGTCKGNKIINIKNPIRHIPKEIGNCTLLRSIFFFNNQITDISPFSNCSSLQYLNLDNNEIVDISSLLNCTSLLTLSIHDNKITKFPQFNNNVKIYY